MGRGSRTALRASHGSKNDPDRAPRRRVIVIQRNTQRPGVTLPSPNAQDHPTPNAHCPSGIQRSQYRFTYGPLDRAPLAPGDLAAAAIWHPTQHPTPCDHSTPVATWHTVPDNSNRPWQHRSGATLPPGPNRKCTARRSPACNRPRCWAALAYRKLRPITAC